jgi:hypothetical protein
MKATGRPALTRPVAVRDPGQEFIDWVLGYGYAAGHWHEERPSAASRLPQERILKPSR